MDSMVPCSTNMEVPAMSTKIMKATAITMLRFDRRLMPLSMPESSETSPIAVITAMITACRGPL
jgi:hypothetical protein